jgi:hypothetical protein
LPSQLPSGRLKVGPADILQVAGEYHYPPAISSGLLWCVDGSGKVARLSPRAGAVPFAFAELPARATGCNRVLAVHAGTGTPPFRGPVLLASDPGGIYGLSLLTRESRKLFEPHPQCEVVANSSAREATLFRGMAANGDMVAFLQRASGSQEAKLAIRYFHPQRAAEDPLTIAGSEFLTPVIVNSWVGVCSDEEVWICDLKDQSRQSFALPKNFRPFFARGWQVNVPPGSVPLAIGQGNSGLEAWIAGVQDDQAGGILRVAIEKQYADFYPLPQGSAIADAAVGGWCINKVDGAEFLGVDRPGGRIGELQPGMPMGYDPPRLAYFGRTETPGRHTITILAGEPLDLKFEDVLCNENSCCGISSWGAEIVVSYLNRANTNSPGLRLAHWRLTS